MDSLIFLGVSTGLFYSVYKTIQETPTRALCKDLAQRGEVLKAIQIFDEQITLKTIYNSRIQISLFIRAKRFNDLAESLENTPFDDFKIEEAKAYLQFSQNNKDSLLKASKLYKALGLNREAAKSLCKLADETQNVDYFQQAMRMDSAAALTSKWNNKSSEIESTVEKSKEEFINSLVIKPSEDHFNLEFASQENSSIDLKTLINTRLNNVQDFKDLLSLVTEVLKKHFSSKQAEILAKHVEKHTLRYAAHALTKTSLNINNEIVNALNGFRAFRFLAIRIAFLFHFIKQIQEENYEVIEKIAESGFSEEKVINLLIQEIFLAAKTCYLDLLVENRVGRRSDFEESVFNDIKNLKEGEELIVSSGYRTHCVYVSFKKENQKIVIAIFNRGNGCENHNLKKTTITKWPPKFRTKVAPFLFAPIDFISNQEKLKSFIKMLYDSKNHEGPHKLQQIYRMFQKGVQPEKMQAVQKVGNCVSASWNAGVALRFNNKKLYSYFRQREKEFAKRLASNFQSVM